MKWNPGCSTAVLIIQSTPVHTQWLDLPTPRSTISPLRDCVLNPIGVFVLVYFCKKQPWYNRVPACFFKDKTTPSNQQDDFSILVRVAVDPESVPGTLGMCPSSFIREIWSLYPSLVPCIWFTLILTVKRQTGMYFSEDAPFWFSSSWETVWVIKDRMRHDNKRTFNTSLHL